MDFFSPAAGQRRRKWLDDKAGAAGNALSYYLGPTGVPDKLNALAQLMAFTDAGDVAETADASRAVWNDPSLGNALRYTTAGAAMMIPGVSARMMNDGADVFGNALASFGDDAARFVADEHGGIKAFHGSPHDFDKFSMDETPSGYLWFSNDRGYSESLAGRTNLSRDGVGSVFEVDLDIKNPFEVNVPEEARRVAEEIGESDLSPEAAEELLRGGENFETLVDSYMPDVARGGHDAIIFRDTFDGFRRQTDQTVVFDENLITIVRKYGIAGAAAMLGMSAGDLQAAADEHQRSEMLDFLNSLGGN